jgi:hypothetical protein
MTAVELIRRATAAGVAMAVEQDGRLQLRAKQAPAADLLVDLATHKAEIIAILNRTSTWLHLLVLADGRVIQRTDDLDVATVEEKARLQFGEELLAVVPVPGLERLLSLEEIAKALAGTLATPAALPPPSSDWLARVARLLGTRPAELLDGGHLEQHDLAELAGSDAALVAETIRSSPTWINRAAPPTPQIVGMPVEEEAKPQRTVDTATTTSADWLTARDQLYQHLMTCMACHAPAGRYCPSGSDLRQHYNDISQETNA